MRSNWLPVAEKYANAWTRELSDPFQSPDDISNRIFTLLCQITSPRSQQSLNLTIKMITNAIEAQVHKISTLHRQEKIDSLMDLGALFDNFLGRITHFALRKAQNNLRLSASVGKNDHCNGFHQLRTGIPCKHCLEELARSGGKLEPKDFDQQWHIHVCLFIFLLSESLITICFHLINKQDIQPTKDPPQNNTQALDHIKSVKQRLLQTNLSTLTIQLDTIS
jgi:hypothetical protein